MLRPIQLLKGWGAASGTAPDTPTLAVADNEDGTGATATITDSTAGTTNTVYVQRHYGDGTSTSATSYGSRTGDGTVSIALTTVGYYFAYVQSVSGSGSSQSNIVYFRVSSGDESYKQQILLAVQSRIQSLSLSGVVNSRVVIEKQPWNRQELYPRVTIGYLPSESPRSGGTNLREDVTYTIAVVLWRAANQDVTNDDVVAKWTEQVRRAFTHQRLADVDSVWTCEVVPRDEINHAAFKQNAELQAVFLKFVSRETRGLT